MIGAAKLAMNQFLNLRNRTRLSTHYVGGQISNLMQNLCYWESAKTIMKSIPAIFCSSVRIIFKLFQSTENTGLGGVNGFP
jgi:hypothetical protein